MWDTSNPILNLRDIAKHCVLLESYLVAPDFMPSRCARKACVLLEVHLLHAERRCPDCITKHFLAIEGFLEEMLPQIPTWDGMGPALPALPIFNLWMEWAQGKDPKQVAEEVQKLRHTIDQVENSIAMQPVDNPACIERQFLAIEGYAEEIPSLDPERRLSDEVALILPRVRGLHHAWRQGVDTGAIMQAVRALRKTCQLVVMGGPNA